MPVRRATLTGPGEETDEPHFRGLFENAPISLWEEDYSELKACLDGLRNQGVTDLHSYLTQHPDVVQHCMQLIKVLDVNRQTLDLFKADSKEELLASLGKVFRGKMEEHFLDELVDMWNGKLSYEREGVNYALDGEPIDILLRWKVLPGHEDTLKRVLVSLMDVRDRKRAERALAESERHFRGLFENSPISLWEEDFSAVKRYLDDLRAQGVEDLRFHLVDNPQVVEECMRRIKVLNVNRKTLEMFAARTQDDLLSNLDKIFRNEARGHFLEELVDMWDGKLSYEREGINYTLAGDPIHIHLYWAVVPGYEKTLERVLVSISDITARKRAEEYLKYLGTHDVLTGLYNRAYFEEERARLERSRRYPVSILVADLDKLKPVNDTHGHEAGDDLLRRAAEVLRSAFRSEDVVARVGGDEFAILMPGTGAAAAEEALVRVEKLIPLNNAYYQGPKLRMSIGAATGKKGRPLVEVQREADDRMYRQKRLRHHNQR
jgi:diguanylate cyclase (GGDEF)-like protein